MLAFYNTSTEPLNYRQAFFSTPFLETVKQIKVLNFKNHPAFY